MPDSLFPRWADTREPPRLTRREDLKRLIREVVEEIGINKYLDAKAAAAYCGFKLSTWRAMHKDLCPPPALRIGRGKKGAVRYNQKALDKWMVRRDQFNRERHNGW